MMYNVARNGDHVMTPFECDTCIFRKLKKRNPQSSLKEDELLMGVIRRINLDAMWSRSSSTVKENTRRIKQTIQLCKSVGLEGPFEHTEPYPFRDHCGYEVAAAMVIHARRPGKHTKVNPSMTL